MSDTDEPSGEESSIDADTLSKATVATENGRRYRTLTANKSGETTSDGEE
jgi:hypothetical protein